MSSFKYQLGYMVEPRARIYKRLRSPGIDSKESIPPAYAAWRTGATIYCRAIIPARQAT
jgi:hypothetical protein